jgi:hypothetical protein
MEKTATSTNELIMPDGENSDFNKGASYTDS